MKLYTIATLLFVTTASTCLQASTPPRPSTKPPVAPGRPSHPPITDQELTKLTAFFRVQTPEKIIDSIKMQNILGTNYAAQVTTISKYTEFYELLLSVIVSTKNSLISLSNSNNDKRAAINHLKTIITLLYDSIP